jgi:Tfp pilus assembly protein FimT
MKKKVSILMRWSEGFSLTESTIVLMCMIILMSAGIPVVSKLKSDWALWTAARMVETSLQWGRMHAISSNAPLLFDIDENQATFSWLDPISGNSFEGSMHRLPATVRFIAAPKRPLRFYQHGNAAPAGTYTVQGDAGSYSVIVSPGGRIRIQKN